MNMNMSIGKTCITDLTVQQKPERMSTKKMNERLIQYGNEGFTLAWNSGVHIEILGMYVDVYTYIHLNSFYVYLYVYIYIYIHIQDTALCYRVKGGML
jgi:hypothetical protein